MEITGTKDSQKPRDSSKRFGKNQHSKPIIHTDKKSKALDVIRKKMKMSIDTDMYHTKTFRKLGQMGKHVQQRKPMMRHVVMRWLNFLFPSYIQVKYADSSKSRTRDTYVMNGENIEQLQSENNARKKHHHLFTSAIK